MPETTIASFILRFVQEQAPSSEPTLPPWRGVIRHVQSDEEAHFTNVEDALAFIAHYVDLTDQGSGQVGREASRQVDK